MDLAITPDPAGSWSYVVESGANFRVQVGGANGLAYLNGAGLLPVTVGGTGIGSYTANNYIRALNSTTLEQRTPAQVLADIGASSDTGVVHLAGTETITGSKTFSSPLLVQTTSDTGFAVDKTGAATNGGMRFTTTSGSVYVGHGAANTFAVGSAATLAAGNWFNVNASGATFSVNVSAGNNRLTAQQHAGPTTSIEVGPTSSGTLFLQPNGVGSSVGQVSVQTSGTTFGHGITVGGTSGITGTLTVTGPIVTTGVASLFTFVDRTSARTWGWYGTGDIARLYNGGGDIITVGATGNLVATGNVTAFSDKDLKSGVKTISGALDLVCSMRGVSFTRKDTGDQSVGVIAQEMEEVLPQVVIHEGKYKSVNYGAIVGPLIEAIKELRAIVDRQDALLAKLYNTGPVTT